jgi:hypothetical protein
MLVRAVREFQGQKGFGRSRADLLAVGRFPTMTQTFDALGGTRLTLPVEVGVPPGALLLHRISTGIGIGTHKSIPEANFPKAILMSMIPH